MPVLGRQVDVRILRIDDKVSSFREDLARVDRGIVRGESPGINVLSLEQFQIVAGVRHGLLVVAAELDERQAIVVIARVDGDGSVVNHAVLLQLPDETVLTLSLG